MLNLNQRSPNRDPITGEERPMVPGRTGALPTTSAPSASGGTADVSGAPLSGNQATESQVGGAGPTGGFDPTKDRGPVGSSIRDKTTQNPEMVATAVNDSVQTIKNVRANDNGQSDIQMQRINEQLGPKNTAKAKDQAIEQYNDGVDLAVKDGKLTKRQALKQKVKFKNAFNKIKDEEMGLFLMDFGMRMMVAGEEMGNLGAIGAAGMGAMGALQGRRETTAAQQLEAERYEREFGLDERRVAAQEKTAEAAEKRALAAGAGYSGKDVWLDNYYTKVLGRSQEEAGRIIAGGESYGEIVSRNVRDLQKRVSDVAKSEGGMAPDSMRVMIDMPDGSRKALAKLTPDEVVEMAKYVAQLEIEAGSDVRSKVAVNRALVNSQEE